MNNINSITAVVNTATGVCVTELVNFIAYIQEIDKELKGYEAIMVAAKILSQLPDAFKNNPVMLDDLKKECQIVKQKLRNS